MKLFNLMVPEKWISQLKEIARKEAAKRNDDVTVSSLVREALKQKYGLKDDKKDN